MEELAKSTLSVDTQLLQGLKQNLHVILRNLHAGWPVLVPYDADGNHEPTLKRGHKAHWALLIGYNILTKLNDSELSDASLPLQHLTPKSPFPSSVLDALNSPNFSQLIVYAKQGKSKYVKSWDFEALCESNKNLFQVCPKITEADYIFPPTRDLSQSLCDRFLLMKPKE